MATQVATQTNTRGSGNRGRKGGRGRGGNRGGRQGGSKQEPKAPVEKQEETSDLTGSKASEDAAEADDAAVCWICAEPVKYYSVSQCNHRTCHVCGLRLRALYKKLECTFCKVIYSVMVCISASLNWDSRNPNHLLSSHPLQMQSGHHLHRRCSLTRMPN